MGGGKSKSSSTTSTNTTNVDRRLVVDTGGVGVSTDGGAVTVNMVDQGAVAAAQQTVDAAFGLIDAADARQAESLEDLLVVAGDVFQRGADLSQQAMEQTAAAYEIIMDRGEQTLARESGQLDQRTISVLVIAAAGVAMVALNRGAR